MGQTTELMLIGLLLLSIWIGLVRETRLAAGGYILQIVLILALYAGAVYPLADPLLWLGWAAMLLIRLLGIPLLVRHYLRDGWWTERVMDDLVNPQGAVLVYGLLAAAGYFSGLAILQNTAVGVAIGMLLVGLSTVLLKHDPGKQIFGLLSADNAVDVLLISVISLMPLTAEVAVYSAVFLAVLCLVILTRFLHARTAQHSTGKLTLLRG